MLLSRIKTAPIVCLCLLLFGACRKDLLHWQLAQKLDTHTANRLNKILFVNDTLGFAVGGERFNIAEILTTRDGGNTWSSQTFPQAGKAMYGITQAPSGIIYSVGFDGKMLYTADGSNWSFRQLRYEPCKGIALPTADKAIVITGVSFGIGSRQHIDNAGNLLQYDSLDFEQNDICMTDAQTGYIAAYGVVQKTTDGGNSWRFMDIRNDNFTAIDCHDAQRAWLCGAQGSVYQTTDGANWQRLRNGNDLTLPRYHLNDILFTDDLHGYAVGENGLVIYSDDGGHHWMEFDRFTDATLRCIVKGPDGNLFVCGDNGTLYRIAKK
jgi:photosystem II stability/assembly factor-like uncharacterized protein